MGDGDDGEGDRVGVGGGDADVEVDDAVDLTAGGGSGGDDDDTVCAIESNLLVLWKQWHRAFLKVTTWL